MTIRELLERAYTVDWDKFCSEYHWNCYAVAFNLASKEEISTEMLLLIMLLSEETKGTKLHAGVRCCFEEAHRKHSGTVTP